MRLITYGRMISGLVFLEMANGTTSNEIQNKLADDDDLHPYDTEDNFDQFVKDFATEINDHTIRSYYFGGSDDGAMKTGEADCNYWMASPSPLSLRPVAT